MSILLRVSFCVAGIFLIFLVLKSLVNRDITENHSLFWFFSGIVVIILGAFPSISTFIAYIFGVKYPPSIVFAIGILLAMYGIFSCFRSIASLHKRVQELAMQVSLLNHENAELISAAKMQFLEPQTESCEEEYIRK